MTKEKLNKGEKEARERLQNSPLRFKERVEIPLKLKSKKPKEN